MSYNEAAFSSVVCYRVPVSINKVNLLDCPQNYPKKASFVFARVRAQFLRTKACENGHFEFDVETVAQVHFYVEFLDQVWLLENLNDFLLLICGEYKFFLD